MNSLTDLLMLAVGAIFPSLLAGSVFLHRRRNYANWAKGTSIIAAIGGFVWGGIHWVLLHWRSFHLTRDAYYALVGWRGLVGGFVVGLALSVLIARPYENKDAATRAA
jgi:TRAP-type C4-dicarboxylate transport system permease small subunit